MKTLTVYGASDDLLETEGIDGCDEFNVKPNGSYKGYLEIRGTDCSFDVHCIYVGSWSFAVAAVEGDYDEWPDAVREASRRYEGYTEIIEFKVPDDACLKFIKAR